jgi:diguanylate cyclase (GGDEF)-like protein
VAASTPGEVFDYEAVFGLADAALYEAKCEGRDRVCLGTASVAQAAVSSSRDGRGRSMGSPGSLRRRRRDLALVGDGGAGRPRWNDRVVGEPARKGSWLIKDELQREHMLDLLRRIDRVGHAGNALVLTGLLAAGPSYGWIPIVPALVAGVLFQVIESSLERFRRPEFALGIGWVIASLGYAVACFFASAPPLAALPLLVLMNVGFSAVFPPRAVILGGAVQALLITGVAFGTAGTETLNDPAILVFPLALLGAVALIGTVVGQSAREHRGVAVVDQLTGVLNRTALDARAAELAHQASVMRGHVALVVGDLDHFKSINDRHGHATGDEVLRVVAQRLRTHLRAFEPLYRFGGEEFVVLLPGMDLTGAMAIAERLADSVRGEAVSGVPVTMSFGVAGIAPGEPFEFEALFDLADRALYDAKQDGRDRVRAEGRGRSLETLAA